MSREWMVIGVAVVGGVAIPVALVAIPFIVQRIPIRVRWVIADIALFIPLFFLWVMMFILGLGSTADLRDLYGGLHRRERRSPEPAE